MLSLPRRSLRPGWVGCAPCEGGLAFALVQREGDARPVLRWADRADGADAGGALRRLARSRALARHRRVALLEATQYQCVSLDAPADLPREDWRDAIRWQLKDSVDFPVDSAAVDLLVVPQGASYRAQTQLITVAAGGDAVRPLMQQARDARLPWHAIDIHETALRNLSALAEPERRAQALLHCQARQATVVFTYQGELLSARRFELELASLASDDDAVRLPAFDQAVLELQRTLDGFERAFGQVTLARLLVGPMPGQQRFVEHLAPLMYVPVEHFDLTQRVDLSAAPELASDAALLNRHLAAIGAALRDE